MKYFASLLTVLMLLSIEASALSPYAGLNTKKKVQATRMELVEENNETMLKATYSDGFIFTVLTGDRAGYQWIEEKGSVVDSSDHAQWHHHSFTHYYKGGKVRTYSVGHGTGFGQKVFYYKKGKK